MRITQKRNSDLRDIGLCIPRQVHIVRSIRRCRVRWLIRIVVCAATSLDVLEEVGTVPLEVGVLKDLVPVQRVDYLFKSEIEHLTLENGVICKFYHFRDQ